jgi:hypothetical protein
VIALLALPAQAADPQLAVDVLGVPWNVRTTAFRADRERLDVYGHPYTSELAPDRLGFGSRGFAFEVSGVTERSAPAGWVVSVGGRLENPSWSVQALEFSPWAGEYRVEGGLLAYSATRPDWDAAAYAIVTTGGQLSILSARPWSDLVLAPGWASAVGFGFVGRAGQVRVRFEGRADLVARWDRFDGRAELAESAFTWRWFPGSVGYAFLVGVGYDRRAAD